MSVHHCIGWPCVICWPRKDLPQSPAASVEQALYTKRVVEQRIMYVIDRDESVGGLSIPLEYTGDGGWYGKGVDAVALYSWMMNNCIVWVEERITYEPEPWIPLGPTSEELFDD